MLKFPHCAKEGTKELISRKIFEGLSHSVEISIVLYR